jgi:SlyX protein
MTYPQDLDDVDRRLTDLEIKATFTEDTLDALNQVIVRQQEQIDVLVREVKRLRDERRKSEATGAPDDAAAVDERPPHY